MDEFQKEAFDLAKSGHNLVITGQAGCGKTYLVKQIVAELTKDGKCVSVVASTGIAATHYSDVGGKTLHKWAGIEDGRHLNEDIVHLVKTDERFINIKSNIEKVEVLIVDEVSMISSKILNQVQVLCKQVRNSTYIFGNIQVILVGDFYQLPPISNQLHGDYGKYCFTLPWFDEYFPHKICLPLIHRQTDADLIKCINELETGEVSDESVGFINSLNRPIGNEETATQLFAKNLDVDLFNYKKLNTLEGELKVYKSKDEGSHYYLNKFLAPKNLALKVGCPVMLVKNLSDTLVNGLRGIITELNMDSVDVKFTLQNKTITSNIKTTTFTTFDPVDKVILAKRVQLPLKVAYAITVHKSQGMSLQNVVVNCENCYQAGQIGVAVGRAVSITGLRVLNFKKFLCKSHPTQVKDFNKNISLGFVDANLTCCRKEQLSESSEEYDDTCGDDHPVVNSDSDHDFSESEIDNLEFIDSFMENEDTEQVQVRSKEALNCVMKEFIDTPMETTILSFDQDIKNNFQSFDNWFKNQYSIIEDIGLNCYPEDAKKFSQKHRNEFFKKFNMYLNSTEYENGASTLLKFYKRDVDGPEFQVLTSVLFYLEKQFFNTLSEHLNLEPVTAVRTSVSASPDLDSSARGKLRYVSGYVLAKLKYRLSTKMRNVLGGHGKDTEIETLQNQMTTINSLCSSYDELQHSTTDPDSLVETKRKQNERESLTNIKDNTFGFFTELDSLCRQKVTHKNLSESGRDLFGHIKEELCNNLELFQTWVKCLTASKVMDPSTSPSNDVADILFTIVNTCEHYIELFHSTVTLFLKVSLSQFRKDYLTFLKKTKCQALRKKVMKRSKLGFKCFTMKSFHEDKSDGKEVSFLRLKSELLQNKKFLVENSFTKQDILLLCKTYAGNITVSIHKKKDEMNSILVREIVQRDSHTSGGQSPDASAVLDIDGAIQITATVTSAVPDIHTDTDVIAGSSGIQHTSMPVSSAVALAPEAAKKTRKRKLVGKAKGKGKGKGKGKRRACTESESESSDSKCGICNGAYIEDELWICCDLCSSWYHRNCVQIEDEEEWFRFTEDGEPFICPMCQ